MSSVARGDTFVRERNASFCCHAAPHATLRVGQSCGCEQACIDAPGCRFFTYKGMTGTCHLCTQLSNGKACDAGRRWWRQAIITTWQRMPAGTAAVDAAEDYRRALGTSVAFCPKERTKYYLPTVFAADRRRPAATTEEAVAMWDPGLKRAQRPRMARFLGLEGRRRNQAAAAVKAAGSPQPGCNGFVSEEAAFRAKCAPLISEMDVFLRQTRGKRALFLDADGHSTWGWGNQLPIVFALHVLCMQAQRYCYIKWMDSGMGRWLGYANGELWDASLAELLPLYGGSAKQIKVYETPWSLPPLKDRRAAAWDGPEGLAAQLRAEPSPLVHLKLANPQGAFKTFYLWFPYNLSVLAQPEGRPWHEGGREIDRCFCRYVTAPRFLSKLPERLAADVRRAEATPPRLALHLRTMVNHLLPHARSSACNAEDSATAWRGWIGAARCDEARLRRDRVFLMGDSPRLLLSMRRAYGAATVQVNPMLDSGQGSDGKGGSSGDGVRSSRLDMFTAPYKDMIRATGEGTSEWETSNLYLALDFHLAGLSAEIQTDPNSSFALPLAARSMCVRRVRYLSESGSACPKWAATFSRHMPYFMYKFATHYHACFEQRLAHDHPCRGQSVQGCHARMIAAL